ncbi:trehalose transporter 1-like protein [Amblyomma americanum]
MRLQFGDFAGGQKVEVTGPFMMTVASALASSLCIGTSIGYTTPAIESLVSGVTGHKFNIEAHEVWFASLLHVGAIAGCLVAALVAQSMGRRFALLTSAIGHFSGYGITSLARSDTLILLGRFLTGVATGMCSLCAPVYLAEVSAPVQRGTTGGSLQLALTIGILYTNIMGRFLNWDGLAFLSLAAAIPLVAACHFAVESPRWLLLQGRKTEAIDILGKLRGPEAKLDKEWSDMETVFARVPTPPTHVLLAMTVQFLQQFSGINPVLFYSRKLFAEAGLTISVADTSIILAGFQVVATAAGVKLMGVFSRKGLLTVSAYTCAFAMMILATLYNLSVEEDDADPNATTDITHRLPIVFLGLYVIGFSVGLGPITWPLSAELVPMRNSGVYLAAVAAFNWLCAFAVTWFFDALHETLHLSGVGLFFSALTFICSLLVSFFMPETQDLSLEQILLVGERKNKDDPSASSKASTGSRRAR